MKNSVPAFEVRQKNGVPVLSELKRNYALYLMLLPAVAFFFIFSYLPMVGIYYAFTNFNYVDGLFGSPFVGLRNFQVLFRGGLDAPVWKLTKNTVLYNLAFIFLGNFLQCFVAVLLAEMSGKFFKRFSQSAILLPHFVSFVIVGTIAYNLFSYEFGALNGILRSLNMEPVNLYAMPAVWPFIIVAFNLWKGFGYGSVVYLAAIMGIDREIYEAAKIDGCSVMGEIRHITLPLLEYATVEKDFGITFHYGVEGVHYTVLENGEIHRTPYGEAHYFPWFEESFCLTHGVVH